MFIIRLLSLAIFLSLNWPSAKANDLFEYQGMYTRGTGGASTIKSRGGEAVFSNPANLWYDRTTPHSLSADLGLINLDYNITTPQTDVKPGKINIPVLPLPSIGVHSSYKFMSLGLFAFPTGADSTVKVDQLPVEIEGRYTNLDVESKQFGYKVAIGLAAAIGTQWSIGFSLINDVQRASTSISITPENTLLTQYESNFIRPVVGIRWNLIGIADLALSYHVEKRYPYTLKTSVNEDAPQSAEVENYKPRVYSFGISTKLRGGFQPYAQYSREIWIPATEFAQTPAQASSSSSSENPPLVEFLDTNNIILGFKYLLNRKSKLGFAYSYYGPNKGPGLIGPDEKVAFVGVGPQDFEGLQREHLTMDYSYRTKKSHFIYYGSYIKGNALNPEGTPNAAFYELDIYMMGISYSHLWSAEKKGKVRKKMRRRYR